jgi:hypothetical protein
MTWAALSRYKGVQEIPGGYFIPRQPYRDWLLDRANSYYRLTKQEKWKVKLYRRQEADSIIVLVKIISLDLFKSIKGKFNGR